MKSLLYLTLSALAFSGCRCSEKAAAPGPPDASLPGSCAAAPDTFSAVTFNAADAPGINELATRREAALVESLRQALAEDDIVCLQEVWPTATVERILQAVDLPPANTLTADTRGLHEDPLDVCAEGELGGLAECVRANCDPADEEMSICAVDSCKPSLLKLYWLHRRCFNCAAASIGRPLDEALDTCYGTGASRIYGGANGVMLLSRRPLLDPEVLDLPSSGGNRVVLMARVDFGGGHVAEVGCTHLTSKQHGSPTDGRFRDWEAEISAQFRMADERLRARAQGQPVLFVGDMNFGPAGAAWQEEAVAVWNQAVAAGYGSPAALVRPPICSVCPENTLRLGRPPRLVDHVLLRTGDSGARLEPVCAERLFTAPVVLDDGPAVTTHLSDHYAVRVRWRWR